MQDVVLIGFGAIGQAILQSLQRTPGQLRWRVSHVVVRAERVAQVQAQLDAAAGGAIQAVSAVPIEARLVLECAGHGALAEHVLPALARGTECALLSVGALAQAGLAERLAQAAGQGGTQLHRCRGLSVASMRWPPRRAPGWTRCVTPGASRHAVGRAHRLRPWWTWPACANRR